MWFLNCLALPLSLIQTLILSPFFISATNFSIYLSSPASTMDLKHLKLVFGILGDVTAFMLFLSPVPTVWKIKKKRSSGQFSFYPYVATLINCLLSLWYGLPLVTQNNIPLAIINGIAVVLSILYLGIYGRYAPEKRAKIVGLVTFVVAVAFVEALVSLLAFQGRSRELFCGSFVLVSSILMYGAPLSVMRIVIRNKSVESMPFFVSLFVLISSALWFIYGLLGNDYFVYVPNGIGVLLGAGQLLLYFIYSGNQGSCEKQPSAADSGDKQSMQANAVNGV